MNHLVVMGGFTESRKVLEPVAEEVVEQGMDDAAVVTLREALSMDEERLRKLLAGAHVMTHSAGIMAVPDARGRSSDAELPMDLMVVAGPEKRPKDVLRGAAITKTGWHIFAPTQHRRRDHLRVVAGNTAEMIAHPVVNLRLGEDISNFSTLDALDQRRIAASSRLGSFIMKDDIFYKPQPGWQNIVIVNDLRQAGAVIEELPGGHDELLVDPEGVFGNIGRAIAVAEEARRYAR